MSTMKKRKSMRDKLRDVTKRNSQLFHSMCAVVHMAGGSILIEDTALRAIHDMGQAELKVKYTPEGMRLELKKVELNKVEAI